MLGIVAKLPVQEDKVEEAIELFKGLMVKVAEEEGTLAYTLNREQKNQNTIVIMERYKDKAARAFCSTRRIPIFSSLLIF